MLTLRQIEDYLRRLGLERQRPTREFLFALHRAHVERIAWQTIDIFAGKPVPIDDEGLVHHIIHQGGGYCFHLNGAFRRLLCALGYEVSLHRAGVQSHGQKPRINSFHVSLSVRLPIENDEDAKPQTWIVDVGLGDMPYEPIPLRFGVYKQGFHTYKLTQSGVITPGWRLEHDPQGIFTGVDIDPEAVQNMDEFIPKHHYLSSSPDSAWINLLLVQNRHKTGSNELRGCVYNRRDERGLIKNEITNRSEWFELLSDVFGEPLNHFSKHEKDGLWTKVLKTHEEWKRNRQNRDQAGEME
ncbi:arylamine N-acetyltransferase [Paenibacillus sp. MSJ-34]|uniref:arylamine N-acetyltransferase family protein n=1 Tax=Paenibacillus sp. MSJ-34 TaxID=2841529 RepID=UPI001C0FFE05|nr:arylamine N-acetyltransferase [Paenibacillus sp. MSJ-34]MBU5442481.1 arylamine N-acetyltransferase [Paenibacillus sp. MSJ-34]